VIAPPEHLNVRTPKAVMLNAMVRFENLSQTLFARAERMAKTRAAPDKIAEITHEARKCVAAAVQCAEKVAPYIHARLLAIESRGDMTEDKAPFVVRVPTVMSSSQEWQAMVSQQGVVLDNAQREAIREAVLERWPVVQATKQPLLENNAPRASGDRMEGMPHPAMPSDSAGSGAPASEPDPSSPVVLRADQKTSRIMPVGPVVVKPSGSEEWLASIKKVGSLKIVSK
jgi:hypothetical protein